MWGNGIANYSFDKQIDKQKNKGYG